MGLIQRFFKFFMSSDSFRKAKTESRLWCFTCDCGHEFSIWDIGGIRYRARGNPLKAARCPQCRTIAVRKLYKKEG